MKYVHIDGMQKWVINLGKGYHITYRKDPGLKRILINLPFGYWEFKVK
jgi:hypothetical protein